MSKAAAWCEGGFTSLNHPPLHIRVAAFAPTDVSGLYRQNPAVDGWQVEASQMTTLGSFSATSKVGRYEAKWVVQSN